MWYLGHYCLIFQLSLLSGGCCIGAPPTTATATSSSSVATIFSATSSPTSNSHTVNSDDPPTLLPSAPVTTPATTAVGTPAPALRRPQRSVKEKDLVDYIAIQEQRYVSSDLGGWPADRLGSWQLEPQVGKRPKRMRGQERPLPPPPLISLLKIIWIKITSWHYRYSARLYLEETTQYSTRNTKVF